ncbi:MAG: hypothetical protein CMJ18_11130 [Phycisphaeraceae bacterium]|nr:hypothetical protein [Phycisphaeraceae bacterium]
MLDLPSRILLGIWVAWVAQALLATLAVFWTGYKLRRRIRLQRGQLPRISVVVSFRGSSESLPDDIRSLCQQDYPKYELICTVSSQSDPAHAVLVEHLPRYPDCSAQILLTGNAGPSVGPTVHDRLMAIERLDRKCNDEDLLVFCDADAATNPHWLSILIAPVQRSTMTALSCTYRWLVPFEGERPTMWFHLASILESSAACQRWRYVLNQAWGGAMALKVGVLRRGNLRARLAGSLTDDFQAADAASDMWMMGRFVPRCMIASSARFDFASFISHARRRYIITRMTARRIYFTAFLLTGLYVAGFLSVPAFLLATELNLWRTPLEWPLAAGAAGAVFLLNQIRSTLRGWVVKRAFGPEIRKRMRATLRWDRWLTTVWMTVHWLVIVSCIVGRMVTLDGVRYRLRGAQRVSRYVPRPVEYVEV